MSDQPSREAREARTERQIGVRQVTHWQVSWTEAVRGEPGDFTIKLILDNGVDEYVLRPTGQDTEVLWSLLGHADEASFDVGRKVLMFGNLGVGDTKS